MEWMPDVNQWNTVLFIIGGCSVVALGIFIERLLTLGKAETDTNALIISLRKSIQGHQIAEALQTVDQTRGTIATILRAGLARHSRSKEEIETAMEIAGMTEIARLEKNAKILSLIAYISPLIGLLGTVLGFIQAFSEMRQAGLMDISATRIGEAMEYALITTAAGLAVAIPTIIAYNYLVSRIKGLVLEVETTSAEIVDLLTHPQDAL